MFRRLAHLDHEVDCPRARSSLAPTRVKMRSTRSIRAADAGMNEPVWASNAKQRDLANVGALARHVRPGDEHDLRMADGVFPLPF